MSSMDTGNTLRSQEFVQRSEMQSQALRQDSANQMVGGLQQTLEAGRQYAMLKAEADARLQMHEQEMQLNAVKLQHMQALDATDLAGEQVRGARLQNDAAEFALAQQKKMADLWDKAGMDEVQAEITRIYGGGQGLLKQGLRWEGGKLTKIPDDELKKLLAASRSDNQRAVDLRTLLRSYEEAFDDENAARIRAEIEAGVGNSPAAQPTKQPPPPAPAPDPKVEAELAPLMKSISGVVKDPKMQHDVAAAAWRVRAFLKDRHNKGRNIERQPTEYTEQEAVSDFMRDLANPQSPSHQAAWAVIRAAGGPAAPDALSVQSIIYGTQR